MAAFKGDISHLGGFTETLKLFITYYKILGYPEYTAVCTIEIVDKTSGVVKSIPYFYLK